VWPTNPWQETQRRVPSQQAAPPFLSKRPGLKSPLYHEASNQAPSRGQKSLWIQFQKVQKSVQKSPGSAFLLSHLAMADVFLNKKEAAIAEAKRAVEILPISKDAVDGPAIGINLAIVYAWTQELDMAFETLVPLTKMPSGVVYGQLKLDPYWDPLRKDSRFDKLLAELAPHD
jgi:hypothetical protein